MVVFGAGCNTVTETELQCVVELSRCYKISSADQTIAWVACIACVDCRSTAGRFIQTDGASVTCLALSGSSRTR
jgi:hypothetical protein